LWQYVSPVWERMHGLSLEEVIGKPFEITQPEDSVEQARELVKRTLAGETIVGEFGRLRRDGNVEYHSFNIQPVKYGKEIVAIEGFINDITERKRAEEALKAEQQRLHDVLEVMPIMVCLLTPDYHVAFANRAFREKFGESHGRHCYEYCFGEKEPCDFCETYRVLKTAKPHHWQVTTLDGASVIDAYDFPFTDADGSPMILEMDIDITERKRAEEALHRSLEETARGQRLLLALSQATQAVQRARTPKEVYQTIGQEVTKLGFQAFILTLIDDRTHLTVSHLTHGAAFLKKTARFMGFSAQGYRFPLRPGGFFERIISEGGTVFIEGNVEHLAEALPEPARPLAARLMALLEAEKRLVAPLVIGDEVSGLLVITGTSLTEADMPAITAFANQASIALENAQLAEQVRTRSADLKELSTRLFKAQEEERRSLALELHDELGQALTGIGFDLAAIEREWPPEVAPRARVRLASASSLLADVDERVSALALDLRPQMLDDLGLLPTLRWYVSRYTGRTGIDVELEAVDFEERMTPEVATAVYRVVQEALTNVARHAAASRVVVRLECRAATIAAVVQDNGRGFEVERLTGAPFQERGAGLLGMRERVTLLGGTCDIQSRPGQGTRLTIEIPISDL
jgi:PAS domain S-box-containing protein